MLGTNGALTGYALGQNSSDNHGFMGGGGLMGFILGLLLRGGINGFGNSNGECCVTPQMLLSSVSDIVGSVNAIGRETTAGLASVKDAVTNTSTTGLLATMNATSNLKDVMGVSFAATSDRINGVSRELCDDFNALSTRIDCSTAATGNRISALSHDQDLAFCNTNKNISDKFFALSKQESDNTFMLSRQQSDDTCSLKGAIKDLSCQNKEETAAIIANQNAIAAAAEKAALEARIAALEAEGRNRDLDIRFNQINNKSNVAQGVGNTAGSLDVSGIISLLISLGLLPSPAAK